VTGHWVEELSPGKWELQSQLLRFTEMNSSHSGVHLGKALYKIAKQYGIASKVRLLSACEY
jgi:hypothetical protein